MLLSVPAATALIALAVPIVRVLFERGAFGVEATQDTAEALVAFAAGLPAFVLIRVLQPGFFARGDTRTPTVFAALSVVINITLSLLLFPTLVHVGIAIATSVSAWANAALLGLWLARRGHFTLRPAEWVRHGGVVGLAIGMALLLWALSLALGPVFAPGAGFLGQLIALFGLIGLGIALYFGAAHLTGVQPLGALLRRFAKRRA
jgi:putative peptidoglycan lipid II flippase